MLCLFYLLWQWTLQVLILNTSTVLCNCHNTIGVARGALGPWSPKYIISIICLPFCQFHKKVVMPLNEHGDVIKTQTILWYLFPPTLSSKLGTYVCLCCVTENCQVFYNTISLPVWAVHKMLDCLQQGFQIHGKSCLTPRTQRFLFIASPHTSPAPNRQSSPTRSRLVAPRGVRLGGKIGTLLSNLSISCHVH